MKDRKIGDILAGVKPETVELEEDRQQDVGPCGMVWVKGCHALSVERGGADPVVAYQYVYIGVTSEFTPGKFWVEFIGEKTWRLTVEGRNLRALFDRIGDHCLRRIRQAARDFAEDDGKPFVTKLTVAEVKG